MDLLSLPPEQMRELGYRVIDLLVEHLQALPEQRVYNKAERAQLEARLREPIPEGPADALEVLERVKREVLPHVMHVDHPRFFAYVPGPSNFVSVMGDALAAGLDVFAGTWQASSGPTQVELVTVDWLREASGLPEGAAGLFVSGGSMANLTGLAVARQTRLGENAAGACVYLSDQTHSSVERALRVLGFAPDQVRRLPSDDAFRLDLAALRRAVVEDRGAGRTPFCVVANAGTTNTGAVDPLEPLAELCRAEDLWLHVDGAYGAAAALAPRGRRALRGLGQADSLSIDPHKWLFQPFEIGCVLVREGALLRRTFHVLPEYLRDTQGEQAEVNLGEHGVQLTRSARALKLWMSLQTFGRAAFETAIERGFELAELAERTVRGMPDWQVVTPAQMGIVSFRCAPGGLAPEETDALNRALVMRLARDGYAMVSSTELRGRTVLRMCPINPRTREQDVVETLRRLDALR